MNWADYAIVATLGLSVLMGLWRGFIGEVLALVCWAAAFWAAWLFGPALAGRLSGTLSTPSVRIAAGYVAVFLAVLAAGALVAWLMRMLVAGSGLTGSDRMLGMVFGLARGIVLVTLVVLVLGFTPLPRDPWWRASRLLPEFEAGAHWIGARLPAEVAQYLEPVAASAQLLRAPSPKKDPRQ